MKTRSISRFAWLLLANLALAPYAFAQGDDRVKGQVLEADGTPLPRATVYWAGTERGALADAEGRFELHRQAGDRLLVARFVGYRPDTLEITRKDAEVRFSLSQASELQAVEVEGERSDVQYSLDTRNEVTLTQGHLQKAACCNLSESFETSATIDVGFSDAVTGAKRIRMLGLSGTYVQKLEEQVPALRGLETPFGLGYVPGPWMQSIAVSKGAASVAEGYESVTGQINVEYVKPAESPSLYLNAYGNSFGRAETNVHTATKLNDKWATILFVHASALDREVDGNDDGFRDLPKSSQLHVKNRWKYTGRRLRSDFGVSFLTERREGGETGFSDSDRGGTDKYGIGVFTERYSAYAKTGYIFPSQDYQSVGFINSVSRMEQSGFFGLRQYEGEQNSYHGRLVYHREFGSEAKTLRAGASFMYDDYDERFDGADRARTERVPGLFAEWDQELGDGFTYTAGFRVDFHNLYGEFYAPRLHVRYAPGEWVFRASAGKGYRVANIYAENLAFMASAREFVLEEELDPEEAWNYGLNASRHFHFAGLPLIANFDLYRTEFVNQVMADPDRSAQTLRFYNLRGVSYANSAQIELVAEPFDGFEVTTAYRFDDVQMEMNETVRQQPFVSRHTGLLNLAYATRFDLWKFDFTAQYKGAKRLPLAHGRPEALRTAEYSPGFFQLFAQVSHRLTQNFDLYLGGENLTGFQQTAPIVDSQNPFGEDFDAATVWGPTMGRRFYFGLRWTVE